MPRATARLKRSVIHDNEDSSTSEEESYTPSQNRAQSQLSVTGTQRSQAALLTAAQSETLASDVVNFLLVADMKKTTIKRTDIIKHALKDNGRDFLHIISLAKKKLTNVFGIELKELPGKKGQFILLSQLDVDAENPNIVWSNKSCSHNALLTLVLAMIFMKGNVLAESELWAALKKLGIDNEMDHDEFGDVQKLITKEFPRQQYLEYRRIPNSDPATFEFLWGPRAQLETTKMSALNMVCSIYETLKCEDFAEQHAEALQVENQ